MNNLEYATRVREFIDSVLPQAGKLVLDIGLVNDLAIESSKRIADGEAQELQHDWECISPGMYDDTYQCKRCGERFTTQDDAGIGIDDCKTVCGGGT